MSERLLSESCQKALAAIEADPLDLSADIREHLQHCQPCHETRVQWLAQEDCPAVLVPAEYFDRLPDRVLRKLPSRRLAGLHRNPWVWLAAAGLAFALGLGGYFAGRTQQGPSTMEAALPSQPVDNTDLISDAPFSEPEDPMGQFSTMSPQDANAVLQRVEWAPAPRP